MEHAFGIAGRLMINARVNEGGRGHRGHGGVHAGMTGAGRPEVVHGHDTKREGAQQYPSRQRRWRSSVHETMIPHEGI
jgi:hypothetical protein